VTCICISFASNATEIIDVRSPAEFSEDHIPGAINLPVLGNKQREEVGKLYSTNS
jgi:tRNA 2-selenouridine synthase